MISLINEGEDLPMAMAPEQIGIGIRRYFTQPGTHPYDTVAWERRDARITNFKDGTDAFYQPDVEFPVTWSQNATNIVAQKYFRGTLGTDEREQSLKQVIDRVADTITAWGVRDGYFVDEQEGAAFRNELKYVLLHQRAAFNSPVWFNIGVKGVPQQASACQPFDALVSTPDGLVPIGELVERDAVGTKVFDANGLTKIVAVKHNGRKEVLRIHTKAGMTLDVTPDHLVWKPTGYDSGSFVEAGTLRPGDALESHGTEVLGSTTVHTGAVEPVVIERIERLGEMDVYDIQTESGEYLSANLRVHNCFILAVEDTMDGILNWYREEGIIFKGGSGSGINLSGIRSSEEQLAGGGTASGPVSFMRGADASAGTIKSGGKTRRAAKMVILDVDHPDVEEFIWCKAREERKARALQAAGFDMDLDGIDSHSIQYQNANNSVRVSDEFMQAVLDDADWNLNSVVTGETRRTLKARDLMRQIAEAAWECADPGMQYDTTINRWHTAPNTGRINASNPCSEYMHLDNSACNLASINLLRYLEDDGSFEVEGFKHTVEVMFTAQEILVGNADYPTEKIGDTSRRFRQLGLGYANLGALLMAQGFAYDSDDGRAWAGAITALMTGHAYATSARTAGRMGPFAGYAENADAMINVLRMHRAEVAKIDEDRVPVELLSAAQRSWDEAVDVGEIHGVRNSQATVLAPTGCLTGGTLVPTERGLLRLGSLGDPIGEQWQPLGINVQTDEGPRTATQFYVNGLEPVVDVTTSRGYRLRGTTKHRVKVVDESGAWVWRRLADLRSGDRVPLALDSLVGSPQEVALPPLPEAYWTGERHASAPRVMTPELAELIGYFMGDGSLHSRGIRLCVAEGDVDVVERLSLLGKECFGLEAHVAPMKGYSEAAFHSVRLTEWWEACRLAKRRPHPGHTGKGWLPHVPEAVLHTNDREVYTAFLRGLFEADGTVTARIPTWSTTSLEFSNDVQALMLALGYPSTRKFDTTGWGRSQLAVLRLLNTSYHSRWLDEVGFISARKDASVVRSEGRQAARMDHIPLTRALIDRLAPENDRLRRVLLAETARGRVSRHVAAELYERTRDAELGRLLGFFYDVVATAELGDEELTYDLSVPANVTYVANGFVSHNTIGLMMDCDTTGIEPDLALTKAKKLVGGGTMMIVNQTIPRALRKLGYSGEQTDEITAYIHEHKSLDGAPHFNAEHLPVFACSMGDNTIHYSGHVKMMAAAQPWLSGAVSKTVNTPEETTVEDIEQLYIDSWKLGLKAVAIYRDNCKVGQPLSTQKKDAKGAATDEGLTLSAEVERIVETVIVQQPIRQKLPRTRTSKTFSFRVADCHGYATVGEFEDGRPGEMFLKVAKQGSTLSGIMDAFAISVSLGLQYGVPLRAFVEKFTNMRFEPAGMTDDPDIRFATSLVDYIFRRLAVEYLDPDERRELGILTIDERLQPTLPGVEEAATPNQPARDLLPPEDRAPSDLRRAEPVAPAPPAPVAPREQEGEVVLCYVCGDIMQRAGSCHACPSCGATSGCS
jgi:ribonucleoside-diphosphate reductase alpha chain